MEVLAGEHESVGLNLGGGTGRRDWASVTGIAGAARNRVIEEG